MKKKQNKRWRLIADVRIQGLLCIRLAIYWMVCQAAMAGTISAMSILTTGAANGSSGGHFIYPALIVSSLVFPILLLDMLVFSNRFAGPMVNYRRKMKQLVENSTSEKIQFRQGDYFMELGDNYNEICERIEAQRPESSGESKNTNCLPPLENTNPIGMENHV